MSDRSRVATVDLGERIRQLRGGASRDHFAARLGIHKNTLARYENGERLPDAGILHRLCNMCEVSADWLIHDRGAGPVAGSTWCLPETDHRHDRAAPLLLHRDWLQTQQLEPDRLLVRTMQGDSMRPTVADGELLFVLVLAGAAPSDGIHLVELDGQSMVKRLHGHGTQTAQLLSDNPGYPPIPLSADAAAPDWRIIGPVIWHLRRL